MGDVPAHRCRERGHQSLVRKPRVPVKGLPSATLDQHGEVCSRLRACFLFRGMFSLTWRTAVPRPFRRGLFCIPDRATGHHNAGRQQDKRRLVATAPAQCPPEPTARRQIGNRPPHAVFAHPQTGAQGIKPGVDPAGLIIVELNGQGTRQPLGPVCHLGLQDGLEPFKAVDHRPTRRKRATIRAAWGACRWGCRPTQARRADQGRRRLGP